MNENDLLSTNIVVGAIILFIILVAAQWRIYTKAGKPGWAAIVPIYNTLILLEIVGKPWWWILLFLIPGVNLVIGIWVVNLLSKSFGQGTGFTLGLIFLSVIFYPMLAFGNFYYEGPAGK